MKTILVPTDFSETAKSATDYAAALADYSKAKLVLLNVYTVPIPATDVPLDLTNIVNDLEQEGLKKLHAAVGELQKKFKNIEVKVDIRSGFAIEEILIAIEEIKPDLVVMGVTGAGKSPGILGSNTTTIMKRTEVPVISVPHGILFVKPDKIALACDFNNITPTLVVNKFKEFVTLFKAKAVVFDVLKRAELVTYEKAAAEVNLENALGDMEHSLYFPSGDDLVKEVNEFIERNNVDMLVMMPHNYNFVEGLFHHSNTKKMAFHSKVPLLSIHE